MLFRFANPAALWGLVLVLCLLLRFLWTSRHMPLAFSRRRTFLSVAAFFFCILGLSRPQGGKRVTTEMGSDTNVFFAVDVSRSMLATDIDPSRTEFASTFVQKLLTQLPKVKVALFPFTTNGYLQMPLTTDLSAASDLLATMNPAMTSAQGTDLSSSLDTLYKMIVRAEERSKQRGENWPTTQVVLLSDGETHVPLQSGVLRPFRNHHIPIYTVAVGTELGAHIPVEDRFGGHEELRDRNGELVVTKLHAETLKQIANSTEGDLYPATLDSVSRLADRLTQSAQIRTLTTTFKIEREFYPVLFGLAFLCFFIEFGFGRWEYALKILLPLVFLLPTPSRTFAADSSMDDQTQAVQEYNQAVKEAAEGNLNSAAEHFAESAISVQDKTLQKKALFNLGNVLVEGGDAAQALQAYQQAYDIKTPNAAFDKDTNQKLSENMALAAKKAKEQEAQKKKQGQESQNDDGEGQQPGNPEDPKHPKNYQNQPLTEEQKQRVYDLISNDEKQTLERLQQQQNGKPTTASTKPW